MTKIQHFIYKILLKLACEDALGKSKAECLKMVEKATRKKDENEDFIDYFCNVNVDTVYEIALQGRVKKTYYRGAS